MKMSKTINQLIEYIHEDLRLELELKKKHNMDKTPFLQMNNLPDEYVEHILKNESEVSKHLETLDEQTIRNIQTLMYFGRERELSSIQDLKKLHDHLSKSTPSKYDAMCTINEKSLSLEKYMINGISKLSKLHIETDEFLKG